MDKQGHTILGSDLADEALLHICFYIILPKYVTYSQKERRGGNRGGK